MEVHKFVWKVHKKAVIIFSIEEFPKHFYADGDISFFRQKIINIYSISFL